MSWPFELRDARNSRVSDDGMSDDSNFEHLSPEDGAAPLEEVVLQWLGERVLSSRLAQMIVCHAPANITSGDLDLRLLQQKVAIPYAERLQEAAACRGTKREENPNSTRESIFRAYCVAIGALAFSSDADSRRSLEILVSPTAKSVDHITTRRREAAAEGGSLTALSGESSDGLSCRQTVLAHYSMALKEHGDSIGKEVLYDIRPSVLRPSMFRALVDVNGSRYEGEARTKRHAKHLASRAACRAMKIAT